MTIIEFFDAEMLENIIGALMLRPERIVLFGKDYKKMASFCERALNILKKQGIETEMTVTAVNTTDYFAVSDMLSLLADTYPDCVFDLTGGEETVLVAMGAVASKRNIPMHSINPRTQKIKTILPSGETKKEIKPAHLPLEDAIALFGGSLTEFTARPKSSEWEKDIFKMWNICKKDCGRWNAAIEYFAGFIDSENPDFDGVTVSIPKSRLQNPSRKTESMESVLFELSAAKIVQKEETTNSFCYTFKNETILRILSKSGTILEAYTLICALDLTDEKSMRFFDNAVSGALLDWDNPPDDDEDDVKNEIDVLAIKGTIPVFISCKNGGVDSDELYKLNTVSQRFGGKYAKKLLVMTYFDVPDSFVQRAQAMNIRLIRGVHNLSQEDFLGKLIDNLI